MTVGTGWNLFLLVKTSNLLFLFILCLSVFATKRHNITGRDSELGKDLGGHLSVPLLNSPFATLKKTFRTGKRHSMRTLPFAVACV